jgi:hypothetical protein
MGIENSILDREKAENCEEAVVNDILFSLKAARQMQRDRRAHGVERVNLYYKDVEGDWLEKWGEGDSEIKA